MWGEVKERGREGEKKNHSHFAAKWMVGSFLLFSTLHLPKATSFWHRRRLCACAERKEMQIFSLCWRGRGGGKKKPFFSPFLASINQAFRKTINSYGKARHADKRWSELSQKKKKIMSFFSFLFLEIRASIKTTFEFSLSWKIFLLQFAKKKKKIPPKKSLESFNSPFFCFIFTFSKTFFFVLNRSAATDKIINGAHNAKKERKKEGRKEGRKLRPKGFITTCYGVSKKKKKQGPSTRRRRTAFKDLSAVI